ncbi:MAG TPA: CHAD domain-containing protein [Solirubrobacteraceae bacterium]|nr:CHAD domain-containing protein [Solirubrobacteraceae bacterium]
MGVALARAERERRSERERCARERRFGLLAHERLGDGLRRIALSQLEVAIGALREQGDGTPQQRVHETRKALKRLRALLRLLRAQLGETAYERDSAVLRDAGKRLARARDAQVLLSTLDELIAHNPRRLGKRGGVRRLRARLQSESDGAAALMLSDGATRLDTLAQLSALRSRVEDWELTDVAGFAAVEPALAALYRQGRRRLRRAERAKRDLNGRKLHEWRKRVKDLRYAAEILRREDDGEHTRKRGGGKSARRKAKQARRQAAFIGVVAERADELGELLGEEHDLAVLAARVRVEAKRGGAAALGARSRKALLKAISKRRARLRKRALRDGSRLYRRRPKKFAVRVRRAAAR